MVEGVEENPHQKRILKTVLNILVGILVEGEIGYLL